MTPRGSRAGLAAAALLLVAAGPPKPVTIFVGSAHAGAVLYGPADMLCDLNKCRLFGLPDALGLAPNTILEFGLPEMDGQSRIEMRRCLQLCRAGVLGFPSERTSAPGHGNPTLFITPIELRLQ